MKEIHAILRSDSIPGLISEVAAFYAAHPSAMPVFRRWLLSDPAQRLAAQQERPCFSGAESFIVQPPLDGSAAAMWLYMVEGADEVNYEEGVTVVRSGRTEFIWSAGLTSAGSGSEAQTADILVEYEKFLGSRGMNIADNCVRTWFFCDDIDNNYAGLVKARRENFSEAGLMPETHYIASTGICGAPCRQGSLVQMDALAVRGDFSQRYLYAPTHLNPTYEYGVTFERGVRLESPALSDVIISGTASIDNRGAVLHVGDVAAQTLRMWENVEVLLAEGGACWGDVKHILVYLRNATDYAVVAPMFAEKFPDIPYVILLAPVCRPDWLIEMECIA